MVQTTIRLLGLGADPRIHCRRGKLPVYVAREFYREKCAMVIEKHDGYVERMIDHKTADPFYIALTIAGLNSYFGVLAIEINCHDMRLLTDKVLLPHDRLVRLGFRPVELTRITRMARNRTLGRTLKIVLSDNHMTSVLSIMSTYGYIFEYDCLEINPGVYNFLNVVHTRKLHRLQKDIIEADKNIVDIKKKAIEDFWSDAQGKGDELANAQKYASQRNQEEMGIGYNNKEKDSDVNDNDTDQNSIMEEEGRIEKQSKQEHHHQQQQPAPPAKNNINNPVGNTSPRHRKLVDKNVHT
jgi:hypothetical protein